MEPESFPLESRESQRPLAAASALGSGGTAQGTFGPFRLLELLGQGGQALVHLAEDRRTGARVALKILRWSVAADPRARMRLAREAAALVRLRHTAIVEVLDAGDVGGVPFVAMRYVAGRSLAEILAEERGRAPAERRPARHWVEWIEQVARAAAAAHALAIVHRDIKPANILVTAAGAPLLIDFGLARETGASLESLTRTGEWIGTPAYLPPEALAEHAAWDPRSDVYMLGATLFECLALRPPFAAPSRTQLFQEITRASAPDARRFARGVSRELATVVATALAKEPERRYQSAKELAEDLARVGRGRPILARRPGAAVRLARWYRRDPLLAGSLATLLAVLTLGSVASLAALGSARTALAGERRETDLRDAFYLVDAAQEGLWPVLPESLPAMERWLSEAHAVLARLNGGEERAALASAVERVSSWRTGAEGASTVHAAALGSWARATAEIARDPRYGGLELEPVVGLVPLGRDPRSGLFEFAHPQTGVASARDPRTGELLLAEDTGLVFVLLPGGAFRMGAAPPDAEHPLGSPNVDPQAIDDGQHPVHEVELAPFLISKYELTQGQWLRVAGANPSRWSPGSDAKGAITLRHPVENVSWETASAWLARLGLTLPTEAQWEYAARGGTTTPWWTGESARSLAGAANLADESARRAGFDWGFIDELPGFDDGWVEHAPVGSFAQNPFGLHDVHGNVWELCRDRWARYDRPSEPDTGLRLVLDGEQRVLRGGGFYESAFDARCSKREAIARDSRTFSCGLRPAIALRGVAEGQR